MPNGTYALTGLREFELVDAHGTPLAPGRVELRALRLYLAKSKGKLAHANPLCAGAKLDQLLDVTDESRAAPFTTPHGYGYVVPDDGRAFSAALNLIRTEGLSSARAVKECVECYYAPGKGPNCTSPAANGTLGCCGDGAINASAKCDVEADRAKALGNLTVRLRYKVSYTRHLLRVTPLQTGLLSAPSCNPSFNLLRNDTHPYQRRNFSINMDFDASVKFARAHLRPGGINVSLLVNQRHACTSRPSYANATNHSNTTFISAMSPCIAVHDAPISLRKGDQVEIEAWYYAGRHDLHLTYSDGTHLGAAASLLLAFEPDAPIDDMGSGDDGFGSLEEVEDDLDVPMEVDSFHF